jgi:hypothetical protein
MRRLIFLIVIVVIALGIPIYALTYNAEDNSTFFNGYAWGGHPQKDRAWQWAKDLQAISEVGIQLGTGKIWYVDSGRSASGDGKAWTRAVITLDEAFVLSAADSGASRGDVVLVAQGHAENLSTANGADLDVIGISVIGIGRGSLMPTFTYTAAAGELVLGADNVGIWGCRFLTATDAVTTAIDVESGVDFYTIANCRFNIAASGTATEFTSTITLGADANEGIIEGCFFNSDVGNAAAQAISIGELAGVTIRNNFIQGDYTVACIKSAALAHNMRIINNTLFNGTMDGDAKINNQPAIELLEASSGYVANNDIVSDVATSLAMVVFDDGVLMRNAVSDTDGDEFEGSWRYYQGSVLSHADG